MTDIPADSLLSEDSVRAGVEALERIHGHHLADMAPEEQAGARAHWREQVQEILDRDTADAAAEVGRLIAPVLGLSDAEVDAQVADYRRAVELERTTADLPETALDASLGA